MTYYGFSDNLLKLFKSYLSNRMQLVFYKTAYSLPFHARSGVPQGSNLGPLLFLLLINDLPEYVKNCEVLLFADDVKLFRTIKSQQDCILLQEDINNILQWNRFNRLDFNNSKCHLLTFTRKRVKLNFQYHIQNDIISTVSCIKDLGIHFDTKLSFSSHISHIVGDAYRMLGFIRRNTNEFKNINVIMKLYNVFVRSRLEYASIVWNPTCVTLTNRIEMIQNKFLRFLVYKRTKIYPKYSKYSDLLDEYPYKSLASRREVNNLLFTFKLFNNMIDSPYLVSQFNFYVPPSSTRPKLITFNIPRVRTERHKHSPLLTTFTICNKYLVSSDMFHTSIRKFELSCTKLMN